MFGAADGVISRFKVRLNPSEQSRTDFYGFSGDNIPKDRRIFDEMREKLWEEIGCDSSGKPFVSDSLIARLVAGKDSILDDGKYFLKGSPSPAYLAKAFRHCGAGDAHLNAGKENVTAHAATTVATDKSATYLAKALLHCGAPDAQSNASKEDLTAHAATTVATDKSATYLAFFGIFSSALTERSKGVLAQAAQRFKNSGIGQIEIKGYTDAAGPSEKRMALSLARAHAVADQLASDGIPRSAIKEPEGFGDMFPFVERFDGLPELQNRRVVIHFEIRQTQN